jgi:hypothetical protein
MYARLAARAALFALLVAPALTPGGCACPPPPPTEDAGPDAGTPGEDSGQPPQDAGPTDSGPPPGDGGPLCNADTTGFGQPCGDCGTFICNPMTDELFCYDLGFNDCGSCEDLDTSAGRLGDACGEYGCGVVECNEGGTATICDGDHPRNVCGGCYAAVPDIVGETCSQCGTGVQTCERDMDGLVCWGGRSPNNSCGGCNRCVQYHAFMDERLGGNYLKNGTIAVFEDVGNGQRQLVFDPLIEGPGANALVLATIVLQPEPESETWYPPGYPNNACFSAFDCPTGFDCVQTIGACVEGTPLQTFFAAPLLEDGADPVRTYSTIGVDVGSHDYVAIYDWFLETTISVGEIMPGPAPGMIIDAGIVLDAGYDGGTLDGGLTDGPVSDAGDAGAADAGDAG